MSFWNMFDKLDDIIFKPIELITDWASEPLKSRAHRRKEQSADNELKRGIERERAKQKIASEIKMIERERTADIEAKKQTTASQIKIREREKEADIEAKKQTTASQIKIREREKKADIEVKKETEVVRIIAEIEEWKKDQEFNRMKAVSEAISKYQKELTQLNVDAVNAIGHMQIELREKAQNLVYEKTIKYMELQDQAITTAREDLKRIETDFSDNEIARKILEKAIEERLGNIIFVASDFLKELNDDIRSINNNITLLAESGHRFIETHLAHFQALGFSDEDIKKLKDAKEVEVRVIDQE